MTTPTPMKSLILRSGKQCISLQTHDASQKSSVAHFVVTDTSPPTSDLVDEPPSCSTAMTIQFPTHPRGLSLLVIPPMRRPPWQRQRRLPANPIQGATPPLLFRVCASLEDLCTCSDRSCVRFLSWKRAACEQAAARAKSDSTKAATPTVGF